MFQCLPKDPTSVIHHTPQSRTAPKVRLSHIPIPHRERTTRRREAVFTNNNPKLQNAAHSAGSEHPIVGSPQGSPGQPRTPSYPYHVSPCHDPTSILLVSISKQGWLEACWSCCHAPAPRIYRPVQTPHLDMTKTPSFITKGHAYTFRTTLAHRR